MLSLEDFIEKQEVLPCKTSEARDIFDAIAKGSVLIHDKVIRAGLLNILGAAGAENVQGEEQQKLDILSNDILIECLDKSRVFSAAASEEIEDVILFDSNPDAPFIIAFDPLDGSSNIDVNVSIGTIFSIYRRQDQNQPVSGKDFFQVGDNQIAAGYVIYGTSTMLVMSTGNGVNGFTLDPDNKVFYLSHEDMRIPENGRLYSINEGNFNSFSDGLKQYIEYCRSNENDKSAPYSGRYIGSMVADLHRNLLKGGIFMYPGTSSSPKGKLRLLYECQPMAFLIENAGGKAYSEKERILDIQVKELHERSPIYIGSSSMVDCLLESISNQEIKQ